ncbi:uncharacterized protein LOC102804995 [Saccoglossus kowalevskii]|uniref:Uncharacterized protein LOC102804995 n=1 Tax=Saccoglossus kowalevskii TaxID=10224 RepID=A0ABM0LZW9_SACKO|nr:PREDICTED: uncharacterized protein LOC102804995 [Saccoglossus kowalevskii]
MMYISFPVQNTLLNSISPELPDAPPAYTTIAGYTDTQPDDTEPYATQLTLPYRCTSNGYSNQVCTGFARYSNHFDHQAYIVSGPQFQHTVIIRSPEPLRNPPPDYLCSSILTTIFCFWPVGIFAVMKSFETRRSSTRGDENIAYSASRSARILNWIALSIGVALASATIITLAILTLTAQ